MHSLSTPPPLSLSSTTSTFLSHHHFPLSPLRPLHHHYSTVISAVGNKSPPSQFNIIIPKNAGAAGPQPQNLYQPYRPPANPLPQKYRNLDTVEIIEVLSNRLGLWYEYAPLISSLFRDGFSPPSIEELTGITGVDQNRLVVAAQVLESIAAEPDADPDTLAYFDSGGSELLYEIRLLNASQRVAAANYIVRYRLDGDKARDVARAIKDFPARQMVTGFDKFDYNMPGDCWAFTFYRQSMEHPKNSERQAQALQTALEVAQTEEAKAAVRRLMERKEEGEEKESEKEAVKVPVVRLRLGEVAEATSVVVLPVCKAEEREEGLLKAPFDCDTDGPFGVVVSDKGWDRWVVLPKWLPLAGMGPGGVVVEFTNAKALPWRVNRSYEEEPILVVADRGRKEVEAQEGFYLVAEDEGGLVMKVVRGSALKEKGVTESLGMVLIVVRPPRDEENDQITDQDWD